MDTQTKIADETTRREPNGPHNQRVPTVLFNGISTSEDRDPGTETEDSGTETGVKEFPIVYKLRRIKIVG